MAEQIQLQKQKQYLCRWGNRNVIVRFIQMDRNMAIVSYCNRRYYVYPEDMLRAVK